MRNNYLLKILIGCAFVASGILLGILGYRLLTSGLATSAKAERLILWVASCLVWGRFLRSTIHKYTKEM